MTTDIFINARCTWSPSAESNAPALPWVPVLFKRRLSTLSRMVIHAVHAVSDNRPPVKITFSSVYGEVSQQWKIAKKIIETGEVSPAHFSLSVFNTPAALSTILEKNTTGYAAVFSGAQAFETGLQDAIADLETSGESERIYVYADEILPEDYQKLTKSETPSFVLALRLSKTKSPESIPCPRQKMPALSFLKSILL
ncbi:MAG: beta-ketoacyl synthase chain length factor [Fibrobacter sp.]|jgi:hypothetical protein|nr:beta-ketoacyl synthase chain length factor [Fibrobacter sp.]